MSNTENLDSGKVSLADEQLDSAAGGGILDDIQNAFKKVVTIIEGRPTTQDPTKCPTCQGDGIALEVYDRNRPDYGHTCYQCVRCEAKWTVHYG